MGRMRDCGKVFGFHSLFFICKENERNVVIYWQWPCWEPQASAQRPLLTPMQVADGSETMLAGGGKTVIGPILEVSGD